MNDTTALNFPKLGLHAIVKSHRHDEFEFFGEAVDFNDAKIPFGIVKVAAYSFK